MVSILAFLFIVVFAGTIVCNYFSSTIDYKLGGGSSSVIGGSAPAALTDYYDAAGVTVEQAAAATKPIVNQISDEGSVLLKNNGVLPLEKDSEVAPFGYAYLNPRIYRYRSGLFLFFKYRNSGSRAIGVLYNQQNNRR